MADEWDRIFETFKRPWKIKRHTSGYYRHKMPSEEEALM